jgi:Membrane carboxypeptidase/penicillin-binding protein
LDVKTGQILAMVGSYDFNDSKFGKFNVATQGLRQPGSTIKPITYALAFEKGYTPATILMDVKTIFPNQGGKDYIPENYDGKFLGPVQLRFALGNSINIPAVKLLAMVGIRPFLQKAYEMGFSNFAPTEKNLSRFGLSITLGGGETNLLDLTSAFSVFARGGLKKYFYSILEISDFKGKKIYKSSSSSEKQIFSKEVSFLISHILSDNNARVEVFGPNSFLRIPGKTVAVKTGTSDDKRDNWTVGYTKSVVVGVWVGNNDNSPMNPKIASGVTGASPIWHYLMSEILKKYPDGIIDKPDKVKALQIDAFLGGLPKDGYPTRAEYFIEGTEPKEISPFYKRVGDKDYVVIKETDPVSTDGVNRWQQAIDEWIKSQSDEKYHPPEITPTVTSEPTKQENQPTNTPSPTFSPTLSPTLEPSLTPILTPTEVPSPT